ncbi:hypothetical protein D9619_012123 [Psilocybe cf. subviscida]|uniref:DNA repair protein rhp7 treble clef domain-containing protein n=1 Tax=Psilocybe cf. subviscida TaxID=2480587 RepID=A0A8H5EZF1_9AGAR|nr:hypothetical protein D9619_012123 [Psilocybe cf. subviscida]
MSRNNVRGPTSALTEFLRSQGITPTTVANRAATRNRTQQPADAQPEAGPSNAAGDDEPQAPTPRRNRRTARASGNDSDDLDADPADDAMDVDQGEEKPAPAKKRKLTKAQEAKLKAQEKKKVKKEDSDGDGEEEDAYTALSKSMWKDAAPKPPIGSFEKCAACQKQFTVTKYTIAANSGKGFLCHQCAKAGGNDPFKKPAVPKKRKAATEKRNITNFEEKRFPTLASLCIQLITKHIDDIDVLGDIGAMNVEAISKALSKNRGLTQENVHLFYNPANASLTLFDATNLPSPALETLAYHNTNLVSLRLDFCGHLDNASFSVFTKSLTALKRIELLGPFLVRPAAWKAFFAAHPALEGFLITQSPRFDLDCVQSLVADCPRLTELRLKEVGRLNDDFLQEIEKLQEGPLRLLDLADPSTSCSDDAVISLLRAVGGGLTQLDLSKHEELTDEFLMKGLVPHVCDLERLSLRHLPEVTDKGLAKFFAAWKNPPLTDIDLSRNPDLGSEALTAMLKHSGKSLRELNINGWKETDEDALRMVGRVCVQLKKVDVGWCRAMDDFVVKSWLEGDMEHGAPVGGCHHIEEIKIWGCNRVTASCPKKRGVAIIGVESQTSR